MQSKDVQAVLEQLVQTVSFLCSETAHLVDDRSDRAFDKDKPGIRLKANQIRVAGKALQETLEEAVSRN